MMSDITWTTEKRKLGDLIPWEDNPRQMTAEQAERLQKSIDKYGYSQLLEIDADNKYIDGHQRDALFKAVKEMGFTPTTEIEVRQANVVFTVEMRKEYMAWKHEGGAGEWNWDMMPNLYTFDELEEFGIEIPDIHFDLFEDEDPPDDPGAQIDKAEGLREKWQVESGQLWKLGEHRVICGDCTDEDAITRLFDIGFASHFNLMLTDPPYNTNFDGKYDEVYTATKGVNTIDETKEWDENFVITENALPLHMHFGSVDCNYYIFSGWYPFWRYVFPFFHDMGDDWAAKPFIWCKPFAISNVRQTSTANATEPIVMAYRKGHIFNAKKGTDNYDYIVLASNEGGRSPDHPTAKPLKLIEHLMEMGSNEEWVVFDPFLGSGTTLIACERLNRKCRGIEIEPKYVGVTLERWHEMTGDTPVLVE